MRRKYRILGVWVLALLAISLTGCSSGPRIITNSDPSVDWTQYRTFGFFEPLGERGLKRRWHEGRRRVSLARLRRRRH